MELNHFDAAGRARMVDVGLKPESARRAIATGLVRMAVATRRRIEQGEIGKGDVLGIARLAGIMGAKQTAHLIPLCHPLKLDGVELELSFAAEDALAITATVRAIESRAGRLRPVGSDAADTVVPSADTVAVG